MRTGSETIQKLSVNRPEPTEHDDQTKSNLPRNSSGILGGWQGWEGATRYQRWKEGESSDVRLGRPEGQGRPDG